MDHIRGEKVDGRLRVDRESLGKRQDSSDSD